MTTFLIAWAGAAAVMFLAWLEGTRQKDLSIVDPAWGPAFVISAIAAALAGTIEGTADALLVGAVTLWGLRLGVHLTRRKLGEIGQEDRRYAAIREKRGASIVPYSFVMILLVQVLCIVIVSLPVPSALDRTGGAAWLAIPGVLLWAIGVFYETVGDAQLERFKRDPSTKGQVLDTGLWATTRHPNYFGDACTWWGLWVLAMAAGGAWWTVIGPIFMTALIYKVSGVKMLEKDMADRRPGYRDYMERVPEFVPNPFLLLRKD